MEDIEQFSSINDSNDSKFFPKTCMICFKTNNPKAHKDLFELWFADNEQITLLEKLQALTEEKLWANECTVVCESCIKDVNAAFHFKRKLLKSQEIWKSAFLEDIQPPHSEIKESGILYTFSDEEVNNTKTPISEPILNYELEVDAENLKAEDLAKDSIFYYSCKNCEAVFANSSEFASHSCGQNAPHLDPQDSLVKLNSSDDKSNLKKDQLCKNTAKKKQQKVPFECDLCGRKFKDSRGQNRHKIKVHFQKRVFPCTFCSKSFKQKYHLKEHLTSHTGEKNYICSICNKSFQRISSQRRHMRSHERAPGQKVKQTPFLCTICGKSFPFSNGVRRHMRIHTGERKYECKLCDRKFMQSTHLHVHLRTHTGERPYTCNHCEESFALKAALRKHISSTHNIY